MDTEQSVNVALVYNAFEPTDVVKEELLYQEGKTLKEYLEGLPDTCDWRIGYNAVPIPEAEYGEIIPEPNSVISVVAIPHGGSSKDILRLIALVAVVAAAAFLFAPGVGIIASAGFGSYFGMAATVMIGSFLVNMALPPTVPKFDQDDSGQNYGYDGAKNTAREGVTLPVVYGQFRVGGNYVDVFTEQVGDDQYLYARTVLSDGEIDSVVGEPEINEQPSSNYKNIEYGTTLGTLTETENTRFNRSKAHFARQDKLSTTYTEYTTTDDIDAFEINFVFPQGLANIRLKDGSKSNFSVTVDIQYAPFGTTNWTNPGTTSGATAAYTLFTGSSPVATTFLIETKGTDPTGEINGTASYTLEYSPAGANTWTTVQAVSDTSTSFNSTGTLSGVVRNVYDSYSIDVSDGYNYETAYTPKTNTVTLPSGSYDFRVVGDGEILSMYYQTVATAAGSGGAASSTQITYTDKRTQTIRKTYKSPTLPRGRYHIRFKRTVAEDPAHPDWISELHCTDIAEIQNSNVSLQSVATGWYVAKMTEQLSSIPNVTWLVKGVKVDIYDNNGNVTATQWSDNPADIVLDMLISERRGALRDKVTIDWPAYVEWREYCETEGLKFNGVFDEMTSLWDALSQVYRVGRAMPVRVGTKLSVAIDRPVEPVMLFGPGNIFKETFNISYIPMTDRANEFEVSYYDKDDKNKKKTIRIADPNAAQAGQIPKTAQYDLFGVDNFTQAQKEVWYQLYNNRLARRIISFDAPVEAIGLNIGDVALIQHDMMDWGESGRIVSAAGTNITVDKDITLDGSVYSLLLIHSKVSRATGNISLTSGNTYSLTGLSTTAHTADKLKRIETNTGDEAAILDFVYTGGSNATVVLDRAVTGTTFTIWDVDVIEERTILNSAGTYNVFTVSSAFSITPEAYSNYMIGKSASVKRPFRLRSISGDGIERRTLTFGEYNALTYSAPETVIPAPAVQPPKYPSHVTNASLTLDPIRTGTTVPGTLSWASGDIKNYAGADVYISVNGSEYSFLQSVLNVNSLQVQLQELSFVKLKIVAFNDKGHRAILNSAPVVEKEVITPVATLVEPTALVWTLDRVAYTASGYVSWTAPNEADGWVSPITRVQLQLSGSSDWLDKGVTNETKLLITNLPAGTHTLRVRSENATNQISIWVVQNFTIVVPTVTAPTISGSGTAIDHTVNADGSADVSFEWSWAGSEQDIDGFEIVTYSSTSSSAYTLGTTPSAENLTITQPSKRALIFQGIAANLYYTMYVRAFKRVHPSFAANGVLYSTAVKSAASGENPYRPESQVAFNGDIIGTIDVADINQWSAITGTGRPADYATSADNLFYNPHFATDTNYWTTSSLTRTAGTTTNPPFLRATTATGSLGTSSPSNLPLPAGASRVYLSYSVRKSTVGHQIANDLYFRDATGVQVTGGFVRINEFGGSGTNIQLFINRSPVGSLVANTWGTVVLAFDVPAGAVQVEFDQTLIPGGVGATIDVTSFRLSTNHPLADLTATNPTVVSSDYGSTSGENIIRNAALRLDGSGNPYFWQLVTGATIQSYSVAGDPAKFVRMASGGSITANVTAEDGLTAQGWFLFPGGNKKLYASSRMRSNGGIGGFTMYIYMYRAGAFVNLVNWLPVISAGAWTEVKNVFDLSSFDFDTLQVFFLPNLASGSTTSIDFADFRLAQTERAATEGATVGTNVFNSTGSVLTETALLNTYITDRIMKDEILAVDEKRRDLIPMVADLNGRYNEIYNRATEAVISTTNLVAAKTAFDAQLDTFSPAWNDLDNDTTIFTSAFPTQDFPGAWTAVNATFATNGAYQTITDSGASSGYVERAITVSGAVHYSTGYHIKKDAVGRATRFIEITMLTTGGTAKNGSVYVDTQTGEITAGSSGTANFNSFEIFNLGTEWFVALSLTTNADNTGLRTRLSPARGAGVAWTPNAATTGSVDVRKPMLVTGFVTKLGHSIIASRMNKLIQEMQAVVKAISERDGTTGLVVGQVPETVIAADNTGTVKTGELPRNVAFKANVGTADVTTSTAWTLPSLPSGITATIGGATGIINITALSVAEVEITVQAVYNGVTRTEKHKIKRQDDPPTSSGTSGGGGGSNPGTSASTTTLNNANGTTYGGYDSAVLTCKAGTNGQVACSVPLSFKRATAAEGDTNAHGKWQWRVVGGSWADITTEATSINPASTTVDGATFHLAGYMPVNQTKTGLTSGTDYEFKFTWRMGTSNGTAPTSLYRTDGLMQAVGS